MNKNTVSTAGFLNFLNKNLVHKYPFKGIKYNYNIDGVDF